MVENVESIDIYLICNPIGNKIIHTGDDNMYDENTIGVSDGLIIVGAPTPMNG
jgi:hypothetical protein